jgi:hypothetical protein
MALGVVVTGVISRNNLQRQEPSMMSSTAKWRRTATIGLEVTT